MPNLETIVINTDLLIIGGGMAACGATFEAAYWAQKHGLKVTVVDKAAMDRSGAVAMGLSAINQYIGYAAGDNSVEDYVKYVRQDLMGISREDLVYDIARHVDSSVHLFEKWGLPIWKDEQGKYVHEGRWQLMINGESYKVIVAEAAKNAMNQAGFQHWLYERVFIVEPLMDGDRCIGAVGFSVRENKFYVFKAKATIAAMGGGVHIFRPRSVGEGLGRAWYPPWNAGSTAYYTIRAGAEMTCQEVRFVPVRFKDGYGPVGAWFLRFKSRATNAMGEEYLVTRADELPKWAPYGTGKPIPANLRNWLAMEEIMAGKGPIYMRTEKAMGSLVDQQKDDPKASKRKMEELEHEAWEDFLDMTVSQALLWAGMNIQPQEKASEIAPAEPYFAGSHSGASGAWVCGPEDLMPAEYRKQWESIGVYNHMTTVKGLFTAGDGAGASSHKFSSGSHAEGRIAAKGAIAYILDNNATPVVDDATIDQWKEVILAPMARFQQYAAMSSDPDINPNFIKPKMFMSRLQKIMDEYCGGVSAQFTTSKALLERGLELLGMLKEDSEKLAASDLHELMRAWENTHRMWIAESHLRHVLFREESRWPGYYFRADFPDMDEANWRCFVNSVWDPQTGEWTVKKVPVINLSV
ncbi:MAG TPA: adenylyl-sulfate reductase subunit alpha [Syntrophobacteraceae bacterium]|nr:adenylyl-sulfate reductase subunit alpha [Syntrophobacteraceae bacterium]